MDPFPPFPDYPYMNGVAREFWREVYEGQAPADDPRGRRVARGRKKTVRRIQPRRKPRALPAA